MFHFNLQMTAHMPARSELLAYSAHLSMRRQARSGAGCQGELTS